MTYIGANPVKHDQWRCGHCSKDVWLSVKGYTRHYHIFHPNCPLPHPKDRQRRAVTDARNEASADDASSINREADNESENNDGTIPTEDGQGLGPGAIPSFRNEIVDSQPSVDRSLSDSAILADEQEQDEAQTEWSRLRDWYLGGCERVRDECNQLAEARMKTITEDQNDRLSVDLPRWIRQTKDAVLPTLIDADTYVAWVQEFKAGHLTQLELIERCRRIIVLCENMEQAEKVVAVGRLWAYLLIANANEEKISRED
jgi:hypothetical protein